MIDPKDPKDEIPDENGLEESEDFERWIDEEADYQLTNDDNYPARND